MIMPISKHIGKYAIKHGAKPETIRVIYHGVDTSLFLQLPDKKFKKSLDIKNKKVVSFIARLNKDKYADDVIEVASKVCKIKKNVVFLMVGDGKDREELEKRSHDLGLDNNVRFLGFQAREKAAKIMLISDINLCLLGGFSLIEAVMSGKPTIAYDIEWQNEVIKNDETGLLVANRDIEAVTRAIIKLLNNQGIAKKIGDNARRLALKTYSLGNTSKIKIKYYNELLNMKSSHK